MIRKKLPTLIIHLAGWLIFFSLPLLVLFNGPANLHSLSGSRGMRVALFFAWYVLIFYFNSYFLLPRLYQRQKLIGYVVVVVLLVLVTGVVKPFDRLLLDHRPQTSIGPGPVDSREFRGPPPDQDHPLRDHPPGFGQPGSFPGPPHEQRFVRMMSVDVVSIFLLITILTFSLAVQTSQRLRTTEQRVVQAEADKANAELSFLKAQINPHFLFNTLNNIYTLAVKKSEHVGDSILKLSNIMRYITDDAEADFVSLQREIDCITDYIDLQRLRLAKNTRIDFAVTGDVEKGRIAPFLLMTFIENIFKYGISNHRASPVTIHLSATATGITFFCENRLFPYSQPEKRRGIGIENARKRLEHLYPDCYELNIIKSTETFSVQLILHA